MGVHQGEETDMALKKKAKARAKTKATATAADVQPAGIASMITGSTRDRLNRFCEALDGADPETVVYHAVDDYITNFLNQNPGLNDRFNAHPV
jgi:hypothetical protein